MVKSVYIHIPFCKSKCYYCSFISFNKLNLKEKYLNALEQEIFSNYEGEELNTLYFGGGTPSILNVKEFKKLLSFFNLNKNTEITTELNPETTDYEYLKGLYDIGINRISLGCQTFDDNVLKQINRRHNSKQVISAVKNAKKIGFKNISLDFIYGLPNQTEQMFYNDLKQGINLGIQHISLYGLSIEKGCHFYNNRPQNLPDDDIQADMYLGAVDFLTKNGFEHYEISNFSLPNFYSRHNLNYWNNEEYYGFGVAAHGYKNGIRYGNKETIEEYIKNPLEHNIERIETDKDKLEEEIFLGFRKISGINMEEINAKYNINFEEKYKKVLQKYKNLNFIQKTSYGYSLTPEGILVSNTILADFLE
mgnify:CR=1 FL=1